MKLLVGIKKILRSFVEVVFQSSWYPNKKIILESIPDMGSQTYPVFQYMLDQGLNEQYKIIWWVTDRQKYKKIKIKNVVFRNFSPKNFLQKILRLYDLCTARAMLYSTRYIGKIFSKQLYVYLNHGNALKSRIKHARINEVNESDYCISLSSFFINDMKMVERESHLKYENFVITGYPRNDYLFKDKKCIERIFKYKYYKCIMWMPTFRKSKDNKRIDSNFEFPLGIPCLYSQEELVRVNEYLSKCNSLLIIKPHPGQDITCLKIEELTNIKLLFDSEIEESGFQLYEVLASTDALITDYSSVYYDYLLTKKPIAITIDDIDEYRQTTGFCYENILDILVGEYIQNIEELLVFIKEIVNNIDNYLEKREKIKKMTHHFYDNNSANRVYNLIIQEIQKRY